MFRAARQEGGSTGRDSTPIIQTRMRSGQTTFDEDLLSHLQAELTSLRAELEHQQRLAMVGTLAAGLAHEINNLMTPALAYAQLAHARPEDPVLVAKALEQCLASMTSTTELADLLLGYTARQCDAVVADVRQAVDGAIACLGRDPAKDGIECSIRVPSDLHASISPVALQQVLLNLLINARDVLQGAEAAKICIEGAATGEQIKVRVADNGAGIPPNVRRFLFQPFSVSRETGHGLGLWICKHLLEEADGTISVTSADDGTAFTITLPAAQSGNKTTSCASTAK